ncbi:hypothetical protein EF888_11125 [Silicimonas algicola]|uniref:Uncharacterized protein n=1 Tax=Silicimonas algicola TaxID=1826607 RepID=A0A316FVP4_9RHOB|nr:hypothetical protein [Silicimonas algicola]AZQ67635.1 hypothetical protein EF888_11125 [Silicimonas algicola]PWK51670.1 hypothetical protein C8D95_11713 [Silicimonas algicola]
MDLFVLIGLTSPLAAFAAFALLIRILRKSRLQRRALQQAYSSIQGLRAGSEAVRRRSRAMFSHRTYSRNVSKAA